jgi:hypothetical protein
VTDASWIDPARPPGLTISVLHAVRSGSAFTFTIAPAVTVAGVGLRFTKTSGPLLSLGAVSLDAIGVHVYAEANTTGVGGGVQLQLDGLSFAPGGGGGGNAVANSIMSDAGKSSPSSRPVLSPSFAVQKHPGQTEPSLSLRAGQPPGPWWVVVQRQLGPLYLERVGFDSVEQAGHISRISLLFDGRVSIFGLTASVDQLSLSWLGGDVLDIRQWAVDLKGLAVSADMAGIALAGGLLKTEDNGQISYVGMLLGRFGIYGLTVFGGYTDDAGSPSFFVFGAVNGPIGGPPAFFLTGIGGGLGINRGLRVPEDMSRFNEYPFIKALDPASRPPADPMTALRELNQYFPVHRGQFWFAAGISFTSFALVDGVAVVAVTFGDGLEINLFGLARMALPRPEVALVSIELGLLAHFSTTEGVFSIRAGLTENSWLLYPEVKLTGGFALVVWWKGPNSGQFVLTLGGYHPSFHRDGYPDVPRLGLSWRVTDSIAIKGGSYFALTSEALMAGVDVEASADFGWAWARIAFGAHGIVYFDPFWFEVMAYARISAGVEIDTWFGTIGFSISIGAEIKVWGPDFAGHAEIDVGPVSFGVGFGEERKIERQKLEWPAFVAKYLEDAGGRARALSAITGRGTLPSATGGDRSAPSADGSADRPYEVFAEFELLIVTTVPTSTFRVGQDVPVAITRSDGAPAPLGLKPMRASKLTSILHVELEQGANTTPSNANLAGRLAVIAANLFTPTDPDGSSVGLDAFPIGAWGAPDPEDQPAPALPKGDVLFAGNKLRLVAKADKLNVSVAIDYYAVDAGRTFLPLSASGLDRSRFINLAKGLSLPKPTSALQALSMARTQLFATRAAPAVEGVLPNGVHSQLANAAFTNDRVAPPMFGSLTDGLAKLNGDEVDRGLQVTKPVTEYAGVREPSLLAYLTSGSGVAERAARTTVDDKRKQRRPAPTVDSVRARLGMHLPVQLVRTTRPAASLERTVIATGSVPRTVAIGTTRSYAAGSNDLSGLVGGLSPLPKRTTPKGRKGIDDAQRIGTGDVVVLTLPDHAVDVGDRRPTLRIAGSARLTVLRGDGGVLIDDVVTDEASIPAGASLVVVQADGSVDVGEGMAGWHHRSRVSALGSHAATGAGCVIVVESQTSGPGIGWASAHDVVLGAGAVLTRFSRPVSTVAIVVEQTAPERIEGLALELAGADRVTGPDGAPLPPTVVLSGTQAVLIYAVDPDGEQGVEVRVRAGGDWHIAGVLGGTESVDTVAHVIAERGVLAAAGRVLSTTGDGCQIGWQQPAPPTKTAPKKATTKRTAKKSAKKTAKKTVTPRRRGR